jgi:hypothetical protein
MRRAADNAYRLGLGLATLLMAIQLAEKEADERRHARKQSVLAEKWAVLRTTFPDELAELQGYGGTGPSMRQLVTAFEQATGPWPADRRRALLIDVLMGDPFAPYELKVSVEDARHAVDTVAVPLGLDETEIEQLWLVWNDALMTYRSSRWRKPDHRVKNIPALTTGELVLPPARADALADGESADALADDHNLALLSGGSLSAQDVGMAAAMWLVVADDRAHPEWSDRQLLALPLASARNELVKAQMAHTLIIEPGLADGIATSTLIAALDRIRAEVDARLRAERDRNEDDAQRVRTMEALLAAVELTRDRIQQSQTSPAAA